MGLAASIVLLVLALKFLVATRGLVSADGLGLLHTIWFFQHHPDLTEILEQVEDPTDYNLRVAGLIKVRLLDADKY